MCDARHRPLLRPGWRGAARDVARAEHEKRARAEKRARMVDFVSARTHDDADLPGVPVLPSRFLYYMHTHVVKKLGTKVSTELSPL